MANNGRNIILTIYTNRFDSNENVFGGKGMSGKVFLEDVNAMENSGREFLTIDDALTYCVSNDVELARIDFHYVGTDDGVQRFWKFNVC